MQTLFCFVIIMISKHTIIFDSLSDTYIVIEMKLSYTDHYLNDDSFDGTNFFFFN